jgi:hypothetical protein
MSCRGLEEAEGSLGLDRDRVLRLLSDFDPEPHRAELEPAEAQRAELLVRFPKDAWPTMTLDAYALGQAEHQDNFCPVDGARCVDLSSIRGALNERKGPRSRTPPRREMLGWRELIARL